MLGQVRPPSLDCVARRCSDAVRYLLYAELSLCITARPAPTVASPPVHTYDSPESNALPDSPLPAREGAWRPSALTLSDTRRLDEYAGLQFSPPLHTRTRGIPALKLKMGSDIRPALCAGPIPISSSTRCSLDVILRGMMHDALLIILRRGATRFISFRFVPPPVVVPPLKRESSESFRARAEWRFGFFGVLVLVYRIGGMVGSLGLGGVVDREVSVEWCIVSISGRWRGGS